MGFVCRVMGGLVWFSGGSKMRFAPCFSFLGPGFACGKESETDVYRHLDMWNFG